MKRTDIINHLFDKKIGYKGSYLEIGLNNPDSNYYHIKCAYKESVDPLFDDGTNDLEKDYKKYLIENIVTYRMTSDEFFENYDNKYNLIFIDGLHVGEQTVKDIENAYKHLKTDGYIVIHDCLPISEAHQLAKRTQIDWNGSVWKAIPNLYKANINFVVVDTDWGCGIIEKDGEKDFSNYSITDLDYKDVFSNINVRNTIMHVISEEEFLKMY